MGPKARTNCAKPNSRQRQPAPAPSKPSAQASSATALQDKTQGVIWACPLTPLRVTDIGKLLPQSPVPFRKHACDCLPSDDVDHFRHESCWLGTPNGGLHLETRFSLGAFPSGNKGPDRLKGPDMCNIAKAMEAFGDVMICPHLKFSEQDISTRAKSCPFLDMGHILRDPGSGERWRLNNMEKREDGNKRLYECPCNHGDWKSRVFDKLRCPMKGCETEVYFRFVPKDEPEQREEDKSEDEAAIIRKKIGDMRKVTDSEEPKLRWHPSIEIVITRKLGDISNVKDSVSFWQQIVDHEDLRKDADLLARHWSSGKTFVEEYSKGLEEDRILGTRGKERILDDRGDIDRPSTSKKRKLKAEKLGEKKPEHKVVLVSDPGPDGTLTSWCFESGLLDTETSDWKEPPMDYEDLSHAMYKHQGASRPIVPPPLSSWVSKGRDEYIVDSMAAVSWERSGTMWMGKEVRAK